MQRLWVVVVDQLQRFASRKFIKAGEDDGVSITRGDFTNIEVLEVTVDMGKLLLLVDES